MRISDWTSDVCSSDLADRTQVEAGTEMAFAAGQDRDARAFFGGEGREGVAQRDGGRGIDGVALRRPVDGDDGNRAIAHDENGRSEGRRGGEEGGRTWRNRGGPSPLKKKKKKKK